MHKYIDKKLNKMFFWGFVFICLLGLFWLISIFMTSISDVSSPEIDSSKSKILEIVELNDGYKCIYSLALRNTSTEWLDDVKIHMCLGNRSFVSEETFDFETYYHNDELLLTFYVDDVNENTFVNLPTFYVVSEGFKLKCKTINAEHSEHRGRLA